MRAKPFLIFSVSCFALFFAACQTEATEHPNFLFIMADDCTFRDIGCYGGQAATPNIDRLASQGMRFTQCFQAAPMCSPTRHNLYTGLYPVRSGAYPNHTFAKADTKSVVQYLAPLGYRVALSGKTHINPRTVFPFEYSKVANNPDFDAIDSLLSECRSQRTPFCLFACSNEPHSPWNKGDPSKYDPAKVKLPPYFVDTVETRAAMVKYLAEITYFDWQVGRCLELLEKHELDRNTLVMVVSEQGSGMPFAKWTCYDSGLQSAMIVRWPGHVSPGSVSNAMVEYIDVLPTFLHAAGADRPQALEGRSFIDVLEGRKKEHKDYAFGLMTTRGIINGSPHFGIRSIRSNKFKYILNLTPEVPFQNVCMKSAEFRSWIRKAEAGDRDAQDKVNRYRHRAASELYRLGDDPYEWKNLSNDSDYADVKQRLDAELRAWMKSQGDLGQQTELDALSRQYGNRKKNQSKPGARRRSNSQPTSNLQK